MSCFKIYTYIHHFALCLHIILTIFYVLKISGFQRDHDRRRCVIWHDTSWKCGTDDNRFYKDWFTCPKQPIANVDCTWDVSIVFSVWLCIAQLATVTHHLFAVLESLTRDKTCKPSCCHHYFIKHIVSLLTSYRCLTYDYGIKIGCWLEYALSAPPITCVTLYFAGVTDLWTHFIAAASHMTLMAAGLGSDVMRAKEYSDGTRYTPLPQADNNDHDENSVGKKDVVMNAIDKPLIAEKVNAEAGAAKADGGMPGTLFLQWYFFVLGVPCFCAVWVPLLVRAFLNLHQLKGGVLIVIFAEFFLFALFMLAQLACLSSRPCCQRFGHEKQERLFAMLSIISKVVLVGMTFSFL